MSQINDFENRTFQFAKDCRWVVNDLNSFIFNTEDGKQLINSSGSIRVN